jgi:hypothetical protein
MMTSYRELLGIVELYRLIRSIRSCAEGVGKLLPQHFKQLRRRAADAMGCSR